MKQIKIFKTEDVRVRRGAIHSKKCGVCKKYKKGYLGINYAYFEKVFTKGQERQEQEYRIYKILLFVKYLAGILSESGVMPASLGATGEMICSKTCLNKVVNDPANAAKLTLFLASL